MLVHRANVAAVRPSQIWCGIGLRPFVSMWFQNYFIPLIGVLFTFPSRYLFTIGERTYFAFGATLDPHPPSPKGYAGRVQRVGRSAPSFRQDFTGPTVLTTPTARRNTSLRTGLLPSLVVRSSRILLDGCVQTLGSVRT